MPEHKNRIDVEMARRGLVRSRSAAADLVARGRVTVDGAVAKKPSLPVGPDSRIVLAPGVSFVSRAGEKLSHALDAFAVDVSDLVAVDIGSSTGGFVDCLLSRGTKHVTAVDVGTDQLDQKLRTDSRVQVFEGTDIRSFALPSGSGSADIITIDVSFISLTHVLPKAYELLKKGGIAIALVKPQFEVGKEIADKYRGVITDDAERMKALEAVKTTVQKVGFSIQGQTDSPIEGEKGNKEFLLLLRK